MAANTKQQGVPELRFPGFSGAWDTKTYSDVFRIGAGGDIDKDRLSQTQTDAFPYPVFANAETAKGHYGYASYYKEEGGCITVSGRGNLGTPHARHEAFVPIVRLLVLRPLLASDVDFFEKAISRTRFCIESTGVPQLTGPQIGGYSITFPPLPEQRKIADFLTAVDGRIGQLSQKKALLEDYKKGVMQQLFTQALRFKDDHGNDFPDWEEKTLGDAVMVNPKNSNLPDSFIYIDLESVNAGVLHSPRRISKVDAPSRAQRLLKRGDILYQTVRPYQMNNYLFDLEGIHVASTGYAQLRASKTDAHFIYHSLHLPRFVGDVMDRCTGTSYPAINSKDLAQIAISIPSPPEQTKIANFLTALDRKIESVAKQITHTQAFKKGLLQQMFV